jgi:hypothetical protein
MNKKGVSFYFFYLVSLAARGTAATWRLAVTRGEMRKHPASDSKRHLSYSKSGAVGQRIRQIRVPRNTVAEAFDLLRTP